MKKRTMMIFAIVTSILLVVGCSNINNKGYIYYKSSKGNFRVGVCYGEEYDSEEIHNNSVVGLDYSKEF